MCLLQSTSTCGFLEHAASLGCSKCLKLVLEKLITKTTQDLIVQIGKGVRISNKNGTIIVN